MRRDLPNEEDEDERAEEKDEEKHSYVLEEGGTGLAFEARVAGVAGHTLSTELASVAGVTATLGVEWICESSETSSRVETRDEIKRYLISSPVARSRSPVNASIANSICWAV